MPRNASGTYTLPAGNPVEAGTLIEAAWANSTLEDMGNEITNSLSRTGEGGMLAPFRLADGTLGAPGVAWLNEPSTGFYRSGTGAMWGVVQGTQVLQYTANGVLIPTGRTLTVQGNATIGGTLAITGAVTFTGNASVGGTLGVTGATTLSSTLAVTGAITATGGVLGNVTGNLTGDVTGNVSGNAGTVTNGVYTTGSYANPTWITALAGAKITGDISGNAGNVTGTVAVANGGTGSTTAAGARTALGLAIGTDIPSVTGTGASGTWSINVSGNAGTVTNGVYTSGSYADPAWLTSLSAAKLTGTVAVATGGTGANTAAGARTNLGLVIGTDVPSPTGTGASGTWGINISGNAATATSATSATTAGSATTATTATNVSGGTASVTTLTASSTVTFSAGTAQNIPYLNASKQIAYNANFVLDTNGNLGVGTSAPKLRVQWSAASAQNSPILGTAQGIEYLTNNDANYGLCIGNSATSGAAWLQAQRTDGTATAYDILINPAGGNLSVGGSTARGTTAGSAALQLFNGTAPAGTLTNGVSLYSASGDLNFMDAAGAAYKVGFRNIPQNSQTGAYVLVASDVGKHISITTGGVTCNASVFSAGDVVSIFNNSGSNQTITAGASVTFRLAGSATTGNRTLAQYGVATLLCIVGGATPTFVVSGNVT